MAIKCRECQRAYWAQYYAKHKEKYVTNARQWRADNARADQHRNMKSRYGISIEMYEALLAQQQGVCAICHKAETRPARSLTYRLHIDHDHKTGRIRGLLCHKCNVGISFFSEDSSVLERAIEYLDGA